MLLKPILILYFALLFSNYVSAKPSSQNTSIIDTIPQWRKDLDTANENKIVFMTSNFKQYLADANKLSIDEMQKLGVRQQYIDGYQSTIINLVKILSAENRAFNENEKKAIKSIQTRLTLWSKEGLHPYLDKLAYLTLQQINVFVKTFEIEGYLKF